MKVCVFCGSSFGKDGAYRQAAQITGRLLAERGIELVYGGGHVGLMGVVADAVLAGGGRVTGVIPRALADREVAHNGLTDLVVLSSPMLSTRLPCSGAPSSAESVSDLDAWCGASLPTSTERPSASSTARWSVANRSPFAAAVSSSRA